MKRICIQDLFDAWYGTEISYPGSGLKSRIRNTVFLVQKNFTTVLFVLKSVITSCEFQEA